MAKLGESKIDFVARDWTWRRRRRRGGGGGEEGGGAEMRGHVRDSTR